MGEKDSSFEESLCVEQTQRDKFRQLTGHQHNNMKRKSEKLHLEDLTIVAILKCINAHTSQSLVMILPSPTLILYMKTK